MRVLWEKLEILGPVYRLVGGGFSDDEIAGKLNIGEHNVRRCVAWLMRFSGYSSREELVLEAFAAIPPTFWECPTSQFWSTPSTYRREHCCRAEPNAG